MDEFQTIRPKFLKSGYIAILFILTDDPTNKGVFPFREIFSSPKQASKRIKEEIGRSHLDSVDIPDICIFIPVKLERLFPLKKEYWVDEASIRYDFTKRMLSFIEMAKNPELFHLLVTPTDVKESGKVVTDAALPLRDPDNLRVLEHFMYNSDLHVDIKATDAAIYSLGTPKSLNWKSGEVSEVKQSKRKSID